MKYQYGMPIQACTDNPRVYEMQAMECKVCNGLQQENY